MLGVSDMLGCSGDGKAAADGGAGLSSGGGLGEDEKMKFEDGERSSGGGNRWPRQETLALLKIRSDMDAAFRDSSLKGPLWDEVSRKMAELGYHRNAKKCKEKFENVYKYHKRTKDGRSAKSEGKTYRFFEQLEALDQNQPSSQFPPLPPLPPRPQSQGPESPTPVAMAMPTGIHHQIFPQVTVASTPIVVNVPLPNPVPKNLYNPNTLPPLNPNPPPPAAALANATIGMNSTTLNPCLGQKLNTNLDYVSEPSSSTSDEEEPKRRRKRKRKWESFFQRLMNDVIEKQEEMQKRFLETLERREREWVAREEAWRVQEIARMNREHELLAQERSKAAANDSAVIAYLKEVSDQCQQIPNGAQVQPQTKLQTPGQANESSHLNRNPDSNPKPISQAPHQPPPPPQQVQQPLLLPQFQPSPAQAQTQSQLQLQPYDNPRNGNGRENYLQASSSRWPKEEIEALIQLRTNMDVKYQENGPKGPLWEEISAEMKKIGYNRNAKRCKEKWENINKYFKKVRESNKKRPEDSKTCPYYHLLDAIYRERAKSESKPIMVQPEQQWPMAPAAEDQESEDIGDEEDDDDDEGCGGYEIVTNKQASVVGVVGHE